MSATIDQFRLRATSPRKTKANPIMTFVRARKNATKMNPDERMRPQPQIKGSERGYFSRNLVLRIAPSGTPIIPETIVTAPKINDTLHRDKDKKGQTLKIMYNPCK